MSNVTRRSLLTCAGSLVAVGSAGAAPPALVEYKSFENQSIRLRPFVGRRVALLLDPTRSMDGTVVDRVLSAIDRAWDWYYGFFGRMPEPLYTHAGKTTIADVAKTCGAACGMLGATGIELTSWSVDFLLNAAAQHRYDQAVFYELGRNFFFFNGPLGRMGAFVTGFAHVHRFHAMDACSLVGAPWDGKHDFADYRNAMLVKLLNTYQADNALTWISTLAANKCPANNYGWSTADFLAAAFYEKIFRDHGEAKYRKFWQLMMTAPRAHTARDSAARFAQVAHAATGADYRSLLKDASLPLEIDPATVTVPLRLYWSGKRQDNFTTATADGERDARVAGYSYVGVEGYIHPTQVPGTVPLRLYRSERRGDYFTTATATGEAEAKAAGYRFVRIEGYVYAKQEPGTVPLQLYWNDQRGDNFATATATGQANAKAAGYKYVGVEGYIYPP